MTEERKHIIGGLLNSIRIFNKMWKLPGSESELIMNFGSDDNITEDEIKEFLKEAA